MLVLACSCTSEDAPRASPPGYTPGSDAGQDILVDAMPRADGPTNSDGPDVEIISPTPPGQGDYSSSAIITKGRFTAVCRADANSPGQPSVDDTSVFMEAAVGERVVTVPAVPTNTPGMFEADIVVTGFPNGELSIRCIASDTSDEALTNSDELLTFLDLGPTVTLLTPLQDTSYANQAAVMFSVKAAPVAANDASATPDFAKVVVKISGLQVTDVNVDIVSDSGSFTGDIIFDDPELFVPPLDGIQTMTVIASNVRGTVREEIVAFTVDSEGPQIQPNSPSAGDLVSGILYVSATITDSQGILPGSVIASIAGEHEVELTNDGSGETYYGFFETRLLGDMVFPNIIIRAKDLAGNQSSYGYVIALDNEPPTLALDSPHMREVRFDISLGEEGLDVCSLRFDPVGDDAVNDGQTVPQLFEVRARAEDSPNGGEKGGNNIFIPQADVDPSTVQLLISDRPNEALIVDTDGDGICDSFNPHLIPASIPVSSNEVAAFELVPVPTTGSSVFRGVDEGWPELDCPGMGLLSNPQPPRVCGNVELTRVIDKNGVDVIYGVPPMQEAQCLGNAIDAQAMNLSDGWNCLALYAEDYLGNANVSPPLRVCIDSDADGQSGCKPLNEVLRIVPDVPAPDVWPQETTGATTYSYVIVAIDSYGATAGVHEGSTESGNETLDSDNYNLIRWIEVPEALRYDVYRTASDGSPGSLGLVGTTTGTTLNDVGLVGDGSEAPSVNTAGTLMAPLAPIVDVVGTLGTLEYAYVVVAEDAYGTSAAGTLATTVGPDQLDATNYNRLTWSQVSGAVSYRIYRPASPGTTGLIGSSSTLTFDDIGLLGDGDAPPTANTSGAASLPNCTGTYQFNDDTVDTNIPCTVDDRFKANELRRID